MKNLKLKPNIYKLNIVGKQTFQQFLDIVS